MSSIASLLNDDVMSDDREGAHTLLFFHRNPEPVAATVSSRAPGLRDRNVILNDPVTAVLPREVSPPRDTAQQSRSWPSHSPKPEDPRETVSGPSSPVQPGSTAQVAVTQTESANNSLATESTALPEHGSVINTEQRAVRSSTRVRKPTMRHGFDPVGFNKPKPATKSATKQNSRQKSPPGEKGRIMKGKKDRKQMSTQTEACTDATQQAAEILFGIALECRRILRCEETEDKEYL